MVGIGCNVGCALLYCLYNVDPPSSPEIVSVVNGENRTVVRFELRPGKDNGVRVTAYSVECKSTPRAVYIVS